MRTPHQTDRQSWSPRCIAGSVVFQPPVVAATLSFFFFWFLRSQFYSGDGDQIARFIEAGIVMVQSELLSHAFFQILYQLLRPFGWDGLAVINLASCGAGAGSIYMLWLFNRDYFQGSPVWALLLFLSSGLFLLSSGHTEYYTLFAFTLFFYAYLAVGYLRGRFSIIQAGLAFSLSAWIHLGAVFLFPSLLLLPFLKQERKDYVRLFQWGLLPLYFIFFMKTNYHIFGFTIVGQSHPSNFVPWVMPEDEKKYYTMLSWGHGLDILWAWSRRSWLLWPLILFSGFRFGWRVFHTPERLFLLTCTLCLTFFACVWHPDLRVTQDWDLLSLDVAPSLLLVWSLLPLYHKDSFYMAMITMLSFSSLLVTYASVQREAEIGRRGYGQVEIRLEPGMTCDNLTLNGHIKQAAIPGIKQGIYQVKLIDKSHRNSHLFYVHVLPRQLISVYRAPFNSTK